MSDYNALVGGDLAIRWRWFLLLLVLLVPVGVIAIEEATHTGQPQVPARTFPIPASAARTATFMDCSPVNAIRYDPQNPCETFVLVTGTRYRSSSDLLAVERSLLKRTGWRHPTAGTDVDGDSATSPMAGRSETWIRVKANACAYVATVRRGVAAEKLSIFPDGDAPHGVYDFFNTARRDANRAALWIRLQPLGSWEC